MLGCGARARVLCEYDLAARDEVRAVSSSREGTAAAQLAADMREETTTRMAREELAGLLDATAGTAQRVTAEMPAIDAEPEVPFDVPSDVSGGFMIRFRVQPPAKPLVHRYVVIGASFVLSLAAGIGLAALIM